MAKLTKEQVQKINYELTVNELPNQIIKDWKLVEFDNGKDVPKMQYIVVQHRIAGEGILYTSLYSVSTNVWNKQICGLIKR